MNEHVKIHTLTLDQNAVMAAVKRHQLTYLREAEQKLLDLMQQEVLRTTYGSAPGKPEWRENLRSRLTVLEETVADGFLSASVGADVDAMTTDFIKAMIITYGSGNRVGNGSIEAGPYGRLVWDDNMDGQKSSEAQGNWLLPLEFNQRGNQFIKNAVLLMRKHFDDVLKDAASTLPESIFYGNVIVK